MTADCRIVVGTERSSLSFFVVDFEVGVNRLLSITVANDGM